MICKKEVEDFVEEAMKYGVIYYNKHDIVMLYYKDYRITVIAESLNYVLMCGEIRMIFNSSDLANKLRSMFKAWEAV